MKQFLFLMLCCSYVNAQTARFGNEWINFEQPYYKFAVAENGVYQIGFQTLKKAGIAAENIAGANFSIYHHGREIAVLRSREGNFSTNDYLEFYAQKRDGTTDSLLYESPDAMPHPYFSLFSDTTYFYFGTLEMLFFR
jgi:hypothetical protein